MVFKHSGLALLLTSYLVWLCKAELKPSGALATANMALPCHGRAPLRCGSRFHCSDEWDRSHLLELVFQAGCRLRQAAVTPG